MLSTISGNYNVARYTLSQLIDMAITWLSPNEYKQQSLIVIDDADIIM